ncbi:unnamed protein product [Diabrotica balteata]|uniref:PHD-type domain-containing protein n=1 Tax=Diabrotica balteata TaxID=107213 RepID=A0A9P0E1W8_DIABA|nr:unnamed protein product [Diabrotica balteata]
MEYRESTYETCSEAFEANQQEEDIDASLFCPYVILDEETDRISTDNDEHIDNYMEADPLDYNIIGIKAKFRLTDDEESLRQKIYCAKELYNPVQATKIHCTSCNCHLGSALSNIKNVYIHPLLKVIICKECFDFYTAGDFELDEDGQEKFCRWCGQGGKLFCCNECPRVFCTTCVKFNFSSSQYSQIQNTHYWKCFICDPSSIMHLKVKCFEFVKYIREELMRIQYIKGNGMYMDIEYSPCCASKSTKRRLEKQDPDFIPDNYDGVKSAKQVKSIKKQDEWETGQIPNNEYTQNPRNLGESVSTSWSHDKEDQTKTSFLDRKSGSVLPIAKTAPSITPSTIKLNKAPKILLQRKTGNVNMFLKIPKNIVVRSGSDDLSTVPKTVALKTTFAGIKPKTISTLSKIPLTQSISTNMILAPTKISSHLTTVPKTVVLKNTLAITKPTITVTKPTITTITVPSNNQGVPLHFSTVPVLTPIRNYPWIHAYHNAINENDPVLKYTNQQQNIIEPDKTEDVRISEMEHNNKQSLLITALANSTYGSSLLTIMLNQTRVEKDGEKMYRALYTCLQTFINSLTLIERRMKTKH